MSIITDTETEDKANRLNGNESDYHEWRGEVYQALVDARYFVDAESFWNCASDHACYTITNHKINDDAAQSVYICSHDPEHGGKVVRHTCHLRICPDCAKRASARFQHRFTPYALELAAKNHPKFRFRKIVLTTPIALTDKDVKSEISRLSNSVSKMFDILLPENWRKHQGYIFAMEFGPEGKKLHFHILFYGQFISNLKKDDYPLSNAWNTVTGETCKVAYVSGVNAENLESEIVETIKYSVKFWKKDSDGNTVRMNPELVPVLHSALIGRRRVRTAGIFYRLPEPERVEATCECCGASLEKWLIPEWNNYIEMLNHYDATVNLFSSDTGNKSPPFDGGQGRIAAKHPVNNTQQATIPTQNTLLPDLGSYEQPYNPYMKEYEK